MPLSTRPWKNSHKTITTDIIDMDRQKFPNAIGVLNDYIEELRAELTQRNIGRGNRMIPIKHLEQMIQEFRSAIERLASK